MGYIGLMMTIIIGNILQTIILLNALDNLKIKWRKELAAGPQDATVKQ